MEVAGAVGARGGAVGAVGVAADAVLAQVVAVVGARVGGAAELVAMEVRGDAAAREGVAAAVVFVLVVGVVAVIDVAAVGVSAPVGEVGVAATRGSGAVACTPVVVGAEVVVGFWMWTMLTTVVLAVCQTVVAVRSGAAVWAAEAATARSGRTGAAAVWGERAAVRRRRTGRVVAATVHRSREAMWSGRNATAAVLVLVLPVLLAAVALAAVVIDLRLLIDLGVPEIVERDLPFAVHSARRVGSRAGGLHVDVVCVLEVDGLQRERVGDVGSSVETAGQVERRHCRGCWCG